MKSNEIRTRFLEFFKKRGHVIIKSASLVTTDEKIATNQTLFNTAGMQPLISFILGESHPQGNRLANIQKCLRTIDIDDVGDNTHATFFEMMGNWSLGDYFKEDAIKWSYEFLSSKNEGLGLDPARLYITVFEGDQYTPKDNDAFEIWKKYVPENRIYFMDARSNWWETGENGPCGPDSEMFYDVTAGGLGNLDKNGFIIADDKQDVVEVWNDVFMQYEKRNGNIIGKLKNNNIDTGAGLERLAMVMQRVNNIYDTDLFKPIMDKIREISNSWNLKSARIVADHIRAVVFLISDGVKPTNSDRGYVLRKLIRRAVRHSKLLGIHEHGGLEFIANIVIDIYKEIYNEVYTHKDRVISEIIVEEKHFLETLNQGLKEFEKGIDAFTLYSSYGFPLELTLELAREKGIKIDIDEFNRKFMEHQKLSRVGAEHKFKGGLADTDDKMVVIYHTATHLLHQALRDVLGGNVTQKGSHITSARLRFDFAYHEKMTVDQRKKVEDIVNQKISQKLPVNLITMSKDEALRTGAHHFFDKKYADNIMIYYIGDDLQSAYSKEFCGGLHVKNTSELAGPEGTWTFKIIKEEAVSQGVRRIKAILN